jgi:hypothetical protein
VTEETVTVSKKKYERLVKDQQWLRCLQAAGVDNWDGYGFAFEISKDRGYEDDEDE